ncbi:ATP-grasp domain-containing protein [Acidimangrovimonas sediminis]|uniref:ATP-grasp domain-containing protein n=1 Tax=Acidimangrovimonas sediminis TaxID=2056283 RepID=UPI001304D26A|nr:ATP-grasp domain-containing protein [Acidimangrovimonas sediminis]
MILATGFPVQYRLLRAVAAVFDRVIVAGNDSAGLLRWSRFCRKFHALSDTAFNEPGLVAEVEDICTRHSVDLIIPGDAIATRWLSVERDRLSRPCFPTPSVSAFDQLNDKWLFYRLCQDLDIPTPPTWYFDNKADLQTFLKMNPDTLPGVVKPLALYGGLGIQTIERVEDAAVVDYVPVLFQSFVPGRDIDISVIACEGRVDHYCVYIRQDGRFHFINNAPYLQQVEAMVAALNVSGVLNFDARLDSAGTVHMLECNPRFWFSMDAAQVCGMNFVAETLCPTSPCRNPLAGSSVGQLRCIARTAFKTRSISANDRRMLAFTASDPIPRFLGKSTFT